LNKLVTKFDTVLKKVHCNNMRFVVLACLALGAAALPVKHSENDAAITPHFGEYLPEGAPLSKFVLSQFVVWGMGARTNVDQHRALRTQCGNE